MFFGSVLACGGGGVSEEEKAERGGKLLERLEARRARAGTSGNIKLRQAEWLCAKDEWCREKAGLDQDTPRPVTTACREFETAVNKAIASRKLAYYSCVAIVPPSSPHDEGFLAGAAFPLTSKTTDYLVNCGNVAFNYGRTRVLTTINKALEDTIDKDRKNLACDASWDDI